MNRGLLAVTIAAAVLVCAGAIVLFNMNKDSGSSDREIPDVSPEELEGMRLKITGPNGVLYADFAETKAADELKRALSQESITVNLRDYGDFEKVGKIDVKLTRSDVETDTEPGDIVLYSGNQMVIFYGTNSWDYTRLAKVPNATAESMKTFLGTVDVQLVLSAVKE